jgi:hypothetical protein
VSTFGTTTTHTGGRGVMASKDGRPDWKVGGITIDWSTVTATVADVTLADGRIVKTGDKYLRYGKVLCRITASGKFGPYEALAADGREDLIPGECFILNKTVVLSDPGSDHPAVFDGGWVWSERITDIADVGDHQEANPAIADLRTAFPRIAGWAATD